MRMRKLVHFGVCSLTLAVLVAVASSPVMGQTGVVDPQIFLCTGCTAPAGVDPVLVDPSSINVGFAGSHTAVAPLLIIVGVPNGGSAPTISLPLGVSAAAAGTYYGLNFATSGGLTGVAEGTLMSTGCANAYACSGIANAGGGSSEMFVNWTGNPVPGGATNPDTGVTSFTLYAFAINYALNSCVPNNKNGCPAVNSPITIDLAGGTAVGLDTFVIAYNCATSGATCSGGDIGSTPFTNAGYYTTPEPGTLALLGTGILGIGGLLRRRNKRSRSA